MIQNITSDDDEEEMPGVLSKPKKVLRHCSSTSAPGSSGADCLRAAFLPGGTPLGDERFMLANNFNPPTYNMSYM